LFYYLFILYRIRKPLFRVESVPLHIFHPINISDYL
jgi:hypothetical protein